MIRENIDFPDVLKMCSSAEDWRKKRTEYLSEIENVEYGKRPKLPYKVSWEEGNREFIQELDAVHIQTKLTVDTELGAYSFPVTVFLPACEEKVPATVLICSQSRVAVPMEMPEGMGGKSPQEIQAMMIHMLKQFKIVMNDPNELKAMTGENGVPMTNTLDLDQDYDNGHWPVREMMKRKMAMVGFYANDVEKDSAKEFPSGLASIFGTSKQRTAHEWGILAVWAFAAECVMNYVEQMLEIDSKKVAVTGHSRCGKAALWCGANDERFYAVMPNGSGCCGAALSRGKMGENLASIQAFFPHWFAPEFRKYAGKEEELTYDQHFVLAAVAPRILHVGSGSQDGWADPEGEYYATYLASKVWDLYEPCNFQKEMPEAGEMIYADKVGYHLRKGPHKLETFDWICFQEHLKNISEKLE